MQLWELRDAALLLGQSRSPLPRGCCAAAPKAAATAHCWDAAQPQQLQGQGAALQLSEAVLCLCIEIRAKRFGVLCGFFLLLLPEIHQDLSSLLYFSTPSCDVNTYAGIHLHFKRTSSHGVRATGCFSRCCRPWWLSLRKKKLEAAFCKALRRHASTSSAHLQNTCFFYHFLALTLTLLTTTDLQHFETKLFTLSVPSQSVCQQAPRWHSAQSHTPTKKYLETRSFSHPSSLNAQQLTLILSLFFGFSFPTSFPPHMQPPTWFHSLKQPMVKSDKHFDFAPGPSGSRTSEAAIHL